VIEVVPILAPILLADVVNPVLFAFMVFAAGFDRPVLTSAMLLLGHTVAYFVAGIAISFGLDVVLDRIMNPKPIDYGISFIVGLGLIWLAIPVAKKPEQKKPEETPVVNPIYAFGFGAVVNFVGIPFALPYFAAVTEILKADLGFTGSISLLAGYNLLYALPFTVVPILIALLGKKAAPILQSINAGVEKVGNYLMPLLFGGIGLFLIIDAVLYFSTGSGLF
jgi:cytochrome c biogenesis protein CcdA